MFAWKFMLCNFSGDLTVFIMPPFQTQFVLYVIHVDNLIIIPFVQYPGLQMLGDFPKSKETWPLL